jgi:hypothetical protein
VKRRRSWPQKKASIRTSDLVPIVGDASIAGPVAEGVMVPLVIFDAAVRPDIAEAVRVHEHLHAGDVTVNWAVQHSKNASTVLLILDFVTPIAARGAFAFRVEDQGILVESALTARLLYLQPGAPGDRVADDPSRPKLLVELPDTGFREIWDDLFLARLTRWFRSNGLARKPARQAAEEAIARLRGITEFRLPGS